MYVCMCTLTGGAQGQAEDIKVEASQIMRIRNNIVKMYSLMTGKDQDSYVYTYIYATSLGVHFLRYQ